jgi:integrase
MKPRDHTIVSLALGTGRRVAEIIGLNVGDLFAADCTPRVRHESVSSARTSEP